MSDPHRADIPTWECLDLVGASSIGRLCFLDGDTPMAYPVSFKLHRDDAASSLVVRTVMRCRTRFFRALRPKTFFQSPRTIAST